MIEEGPPTLRASILTLQHRQTRLPGRSHRRLACHCRLRRDLHHHLTAKAAKQARYEHRETSELRRDQWLLTDRCQLAEQPLDLGMRLRVEYLLVHKLLHNMG